MIRTLAASILPAAVTVVAWLRFEQPREQAWRALAVAAIALAVAAAPRWWLRLSGLVAGAGVAGRLAFGLSAFHGRSYGAAVSRFREGFLDFYDVHLPFDPRLHADMHAVLLVAVFAFTLLVASAAAARRPLLASLALLAGAGWPATLLGPSRAVLMGTAILVAELALLAGLTARRLPRGAVAATAAVAVAAAVLGGSPALARHELVAWQTWRPAAQAPSVAVAFVWNAQYAGLRFPPRATTVLEVAAPASDSLYWRAGVLDDFAGGAWASGPLRPADSLEPPAAYRPADEVEQTVTVEGLADTRLVGGSAPIRFDAADVVTPVPGFAFVPPGLSRGYRYRVWSYAPQPTAAELEDSPARYPPELARDGLLALPRSAAYAPLWRAARETTRRARTPYERVVGLERWFRETGGFRYSNRPPVGSPPLVAFVTRTRAGYCQHFAGAMALMLRSLGIPARVAVGFSSGTYDASGHVWVVTDRDAHAWVEAWFAGYGWLPFDPTPPAGRPESGTLSAAYSAASPSFSPPQGGAATRVGPAPPFGGRGAGIESRAPHTAPAAAPAAGPDASETALLAVLALAAALFVAMVAANRVRILVGLRSRDPRRAAAAVRAELAGFLIDQGFPEAARGTLSELGGLVRREFGVDAGALVAAASAARFAPPDEASAALPQARRELRELLGALRRSLTLGRRLRGLASLRSLRTVDGSASLVGEGSA